MVLDTVFDALSGKL